MTPDQADRLIAVVEGTLWLVRCAAWVMIVSSTVSGLAFLGGVAWGYRKFIKPIKMSGLLGG